MLEFVLRSVFFALFLKDLYVCFLFALYSHIHTLFFKHTCMNTCTPCIHRHTYSLIYLSLTHVRARTHTHTHSLSLSLLQMCTLKIKHIHCISMYKSCIIYSLNILFCHHENLPWLPRQHSCLRWLVLVVRSVSPILCCWRIGVFFFFFYFFFVLFWGVKTRTNYLKIIHCSFFCICLLMFMQI